MLGLREEVGSHEVGPCRPVGHHHHLGGSGRHIDGSTPGTHHLLSLGDITVAGAENLVHPTDTFGTIGHGGNGLGSAQLIDGIHATQLCGIEHYRVHLARDAVARGAEHNLLTPGNLCRESQHQDCGEERGTASGDVEAHPTYGKHTTATVYTGHGVYICLRCLLCLMESTDIIGRLTDGSFQSITNLGRSLGKLGLGDL